MDHSSLTLSRKPQQSIELSFVDENGFEQSIFLTVQKVKNRQVKLTFDAPREVQITRAELLQHPINLTP